MDSIRVRGSVRRSHKALLLTAAVAVFALLTWSAQGGDVESSVCADCHTDIAEMFSKTPHGTYFSSRPALSEYSCESCHGSGLQHIEEGTAETILNPAKTDQFGTSLLCLECHKTEQFSEWDFSHHNAADVNCSSCHQAHVTATDAQKKSDPDLCYECHGDVLAATRMPSHHPIREGKVSCSDCHNPHGGTVQLVRDNDSRELCFTCHPQMEGPWVFEHSPVAEDCMICHTPHGSVADNLLKAQEPTLCLNCHPMHFHASVEGWDGQTSTPVAPDRIVNSTPDAWKSGMLTKCTQCHQQIHGSDSPSQATSAGGTGLTR